MSRKTIDRRAMLAIGAALPALATSQALAISSSCVAVADPIFAAIEAHQEAKEEADALKAEHTPEYDKYVGSVLFGEDGPRTLTDDDRAEMDRGAKHPDFVRTRNRWDAAADMAAEKLRALAATKPTTLAGVAAAAAYLADHLDDLDPDDVMDAEDAPSFSVAFMDVIAEALAALAEGGAA
jgi:hypothetical protein